MNVRRLSRKQGRVRVSSIVERVDAGRVVPTGRFSLPREEHIFDESSSIPFQSLRKVAEKWRIQKKLEHTYDSMVNSSHAVNNAAD
jgi:DNA replicative helicase MCM subunit Mcm2 (Cdc46/Mcm family)